MDADNRSDDSKVDEALEETFPASDAPANTPETGIRIGNPSAGDVDAASETEEPGVQSQHPTKSPRQSR